MVRTTAQPLEAVPWWAGNARLTNLSGKLLGAMDASAVCLVWRGVSVLQFGCAGESWALLPHCLFQ